MRYAIVCLNELRNPLMGGHEKLPEIGLCTLRRDAERILEQVNRLCSGEHFLCVTYALEVMPSPDCCTFRHANANAPWSCDCECHNAPTA